MRRYIIVSSFFLAALTGVPWLATTAFAAPPNADNTEDTRSPIHRSPAHHSSVEQARRWHLTVTEWDRYRDLLTGPQKFRAPGLDPVWVLGIHAQTKSEQIRYAELAVRNERAAVERELAFMRAYVDTARRLYPDQGLIDAALHRDFRQRLGLEGNNHQSIVPDDRYLFFTRLQCDACKEILPRLLRRVRQDGAGLDVYFMDAADDGAIRRWATAHHIPTLLVKGRQVTLNHDRGLARRLGAAPPGVYRREAGTLRPVTLEGG